MLLIYEKFVKRFEIIDDSVFFFHVQYMRIEPISSIALLASKDFT